jgi:hypothetical protein
MVFKDGDKVKVRDAVSVDVLIYDMFRVVEEDDCPAYLDTALELMDDTLTVTVNEDNEDDGTVCVMDSKGFPFYIGAELLGLVEEKVEEKNENEKAELDMKVIEDYVKPLQDYLRSLDGFTELKVTVGGNYVEVRDLLDIRFRHDV